MSYALDVNVLLYASDRSSPRHEAARRFLEDRAADPEPLYLTWPTLIGYLRMSTHPGIFSAPLTPEQALANVTALLSLPHVRPLGEKDGFLAVYAQVTSRFPVRGNLVPDAHIAAILLQHDVRTLYTSDADFRKFDSVDARDPFA